jgi:hypothetical protein
MAPMDELKALHLTVGAWWRVAAVLCVAWIVTASLEGSSLFGIVTLPLLVALWAYAILVIDHWVGRQHD